MLTLGMHYEDKINGTENAEHKLTHTHFLVKNRYKL